MPYVNVWIDNDEVIEASDDDDLIEMLESRGYSCFKYSGGQHGEYSSVEHLMDCGMVNEAKAEALLIVGKAIGRSL
jgi:hypothetical protein